MALPAVLSEPLFASKSTVSSLLGIALIPFIHEGEVVLVKLARRGPTHPTTVVFRVPSLRVVLSCSPFYIPVLTLYFRSPSFGGDGSGPMFEPDEDQE